MKGTYILPSYTLLAIQLFNICLSNEKCNKCILENKDRTSFCQESSPIPGDLRGFDVFTNSPFIKKCDSYSSCRECLENNQGHIQYCYSNLISKAFHKYRYPYA